MSEVVEGLDLREVPARGRPPKYRWSTLFDGRTHRMVLGVHYEADSIRGFRSTVYSAARRRGIEVLTRVIDGDLHIQAILPPGATNGHTTPDEGDTDAGTD